MESIQLEEFSRKSDARAEVSRGATNAGSDYGPRYDSSHDERGAYS